MKMLMHGYKHAETITYRANISACRWGVTTSLSCDGFGIRKLPTYFLISPDGTIVEQDAPFGQIESYLTTGNTSSEQANVSYKVSLVDFWFYTTTMLFCT